MTDLYKFKLNGKERENKLDLADYDSLVNKTKKMSKEDLENYYIDRNNKKDLSGWAYFWVVVVIALMVFLIVSITSLEIKENSIDEIQDESKELCKYLPEDYQSHVLVDTLLFKNEYSKYLRIDCTNLN